MYNIEWNPSKRVQPRVAGELLPPGSCIICQRPDVVEGYLDLAVYDEFIGQTYICIPCVEQDIMPVIGGLSYPEANQIKGLLDTLNNQLKEALESNAILNGKLSSLRGAFRIVTTDSSSINVLDDSLVNGGEEQTDQISLFEDSVTRESGTEPTESVESTRPNDNSGSESSDRNTDSKKPVFNI